MHQPRLSPVEEWCAQIFLCVSRPKQRCLKECATLQALLLGRGKNERALTVSQLSNISFTFTHLFQFLS